MIRLLVTLLLMAVAACAPRYATKPEPKTAKLFGTWWRVEEIDGRKAEFIRGQRRDMHIILYSSRTMVGSGGCNQINGSFSLSPGGVIRFGAPASTKMMCLPEVMSRDRAFFGALRTAQRYVIDGYRLKLFDRDGREVLRFLAVSPR